MMISIEVLTTHCRNFEHNYWWLKSYSGKLFIIPDRSFCEKCGL